MKPILFLDFDNTLFDTMRFIFRFWDIVQAEYGILPQEGAGRLQDLYREQGNTQSYDLEIHLRQLGLEFDVSLDLVKRQIRSGHEDFLFPDAASAITNLIKRYEVRVLTLGQQEWQQYKLGFCPLLKRVPIHIVQEEKGTWLANHHKSDTGWLVDDRALGTSVPDNFKFIRINRHKSPRYSRISRGETVIGSLLVLDKYLQADDQS